MGPVLQTSINPPDLFVDKQDLSQYERNLEDGAVLVVLTLSIRVILFSFILAKRILAYMIDLTEKLVKSLKTILIALI